MASVASTYARAFADVVFSAHLDAARAIGGLRQIAALFEQSADLRRVWENPAVPAEDRGAVRKRIGPAHGIGRCADFQRARTGRCRKAHVGSRDREVDGKE